MSRGGRQVINRVVTQLVPVAVFGLALFTTVLVGGVVLTLSGFQAFHVYAQLLVGAVGSLPAVAGSLVYTTPILFTALAASVAFRAGIWNIGGDGQLVMGAFGAALVALNAPVAWGWWLLPLVLSGSAALGALWALVAAFLKVWSGVNEILTTLMLNYVAFLWIDFLLVGPWKDPAMGGWPMSPPFPPGARLPSFPGTGLHLGLALAAATAVVLHIVLKHSRWGYELSILGASSRTARYTGIAANRNIVLVMMLSGGIAALAGAGEVSGVGYRLFQLDREGYGYIGILVSWLSGHSPLVTMITAFFFGSLLQGGAALKLAGIQPSIVRMLQAVLIMAVLGGLEVSHRWRPALIDRKGPAGLPEAAK